MPQPSFTTPEERESEFFQLLKESLEERESAVPENLAFLKAGRENLDHEPIGEEDGYVNYIYRISEKSPGKQSVVVKWTRLMNRILEQERLEIKMPAEYEQMDEHDVLQRNTRESEELQRVEGMEPGSTPKVFWVDAKRYFFIMEDLSADYITLRQLLINGVVSTDVFINISRILATLHKAHHVNTIGQEEFDKFAASLYKSPMITDQLAMVFFDMAFKSKVSVVVSEGRKFSDAMNEVIQELYDNEEIDKVLSRLKESFFDTRVCYLHNDSHPGAFMVNPGTVDVRILDMEIAGAGNPAKEIGYALGEVVMFWYVYRGRGEPELAEQIRSVVRVFVTDYLERMGPCIDDRERFMRYLAGHAGHFAGLRVASKYIGFKPLAPYEQAEADGTWAAVRLMKGMDGITTLDHFISTAFQ